MLQIKTAEFVKSAADKAGLLKGLPQIVFAGKSNCGKSSLLNMLANNGKLARTSSTPGSTQLINYFLINKAFYFVDLPGYGYAKSGKSRLASFSALAHNFLVDNEEIKQLFLLIDIRNGAGQNDIEFTEFLNYHQIPFTIIATKADKLSRVQMFGARRDLATDLKLGEQNIVISSSASRLGKEEILEIINKRIN